MFSRTTFEVVETSTGTVVAEFETKARAFGMVDQGAKEDVVFHVRPVFNAW